MGHVLTTLPPVSTNVLAFFSHHFVAPCHDGCAPRCHLLHSSSSNQISRAHDLLSVWHHCDHRLQRRQIGSISMTTPNHRRMQPDTLHGALFRSWGTFPELAGQADQLAKSPLVLERDGAAQRHAQCHLVWKRCVPSHFPVRIPMLCVFSLCL